LGLCANSSAALRREIRAGTLKAASASADHHPERLRPRWDIITKPGMCGFIGGGSAESGSVGRRMKGFREA
jgi:hypothetical protein